MVNGILIGGSPSTGSSVLVNLMNRHSALLGGPETYLFMHPSLYSDWEGSSKFLVRGRRWGRLKSIGWFAFSGALLLDPFFGWDAAGVNELIKGSKGFPEFAHGYFGPAMKEKGARCWVEKSPSNALCMGEFLLYFPKGRVVHTTRNPYDTIGSLHARGLSVFDATASYLVNTAFALRQAGEERYFLLRYEDWVREPEKQISALFGWLHLDWEPGVLEPAGNEPEVRMGGWLHSERGKLGTTSIGRFERMKPEDRDSIRFAVHHLRIKKTYCERHRLPVDSIAGICRMLDYELQPAPAAGFRRKLFAGWLADQNRRMLRLYPCMGSRYPVTF